MLVRAWSWSGGGRVKIGGWGSSSVGGDMEHTGHSKHVRGAKEI